MSDIKLVKAAELFGLTRDILEQGRQAWITVTGMSMYPFLRGGRDSVELTKTDFSQIKKGDIVLIKRTNGDYVLHRVIRVADDSFYMIGDAQQWVEGPLLPHQLEAVVTTIKRKGRIISCSHPAMRGCVFIWRLLIPVRYKLLKLLTFGKRTAGWLARRFKKHA